MATYNEIKGDNIEVRATDPANPGEGEIWYNSTTGVIKVYKNIGGAWASGNPVNTARHRIGSAGIQTAALMFGGTTGFQTESYDGTNWTSLSNMSRTTGNQMGAGCGEQTAALGFGGYGPPSMNTASESWDGTSWTSTPPINTARASGGGAGTQTAAAYFGGYRILPPGNTYGSFSNTEEYNGSAWTTVNSLGTGRTGNGGAGIQTAALAVGGGDTIPSSGIANTEEYDGTNWTAGGNLGTARYGLAAAGSQTATLAFAGYPVPTNGTLTESYDGSSWTSKSNMTTQRYEPGGFGTQTAALAASGSPGAGPASNVTEEWTDPSFGKQSVTTS